MNKTIIKEKVETLINEMGGYIEIFDFDLSHDLNVEDIVERIVDLGEDPSEVAAFVRGVLIDQAFEYDCCTTEQARVILNHYSGYEMAKLCLGEQSYRTQPDLLEVAARARFLKMTGSNLTRLIEEFEEELELIYEAEVYEVD